MQIKQLTPDDAATYQDLRLFALEESPTAFGSSYAEEAGRPLQEVADRLQDTANHVFGAFSDGQLVAIITLRRGHHTKTAHKAHIFAMYVHPKHRRQGLGRALLETAISRAHELGLRQINLSVVKANEAAILLYETCGFEQYGLEKQAFKTGNRFYDVAHMALHLQEDESP